MDDHKTTSLKNCQDSSMMERLKPKSEFSQNVLTLMTGTTIAQAIPVAISPILTRIYTPEDFGVFALFIAISTIFSSFANGRYDLAIMLPKKDEDAINIFALGLIINLIISLILLVIVLFYNENIASLLNNKEIGAWLYVIPISVFLVGIWEMLSYFNNRKKRYNDIATTTIIRSIILTSIQLIVGFVKQGPTGLISGQLFSQMLANLILFRKLVNNKILFSYIKVVKIIALAKKYRKFPKFSMWSGLLNIASLQMPVILLGSFFSITTVGLFSLSHRVISMPMSLIGGSIGQVFYQRSVEIKNNREALKNLTLKTYKNLFQIGILPFSIILVFGDYIFATVFGGDWRVSGEYAQILSFWILLVFISSPLTALLSTLEKQKEALYFNVAIFCSRILSLVYGGLVLENAYQTILIFGLVSTIFWLFWVFYILHLAYVDIIPVLLFTFKYLLLVIGILYFIRIIF